jgi:uncharacterized protein HemX
MLFAAVERRKAQPSCLGATDSQWLSPSTSGRSDRDHTSAASPDKDEPRTLQKNAVGIATVWLLLYAIALAAGAYGGFESLRQSFEISALH